VESRKSSKLTGWIIVRPVRLGGRGGEAGAAERVALESRRGDHCFPTIRLGMDCFFSFHWPFLRSSSGQLDRITPPCANIQTKKEPNFTWKFSISGVIGKRRNPRRLPLPYRAFTDREPPSPLTCGNVSASSIYM
jgi:hypothetical protein